MLMLLCFLLGSVLGCFVGSAAEAETEVAGLLSETAAEGVLGFLSSLWTVGWYHLVIILAATSVLGIMMIPTTLFLRGYFLSCTVSATIAVLPEHGILAALISCGIGALLTIPGLFLLALDGFGLSRRLWALSAGRSSHFGGGNVSGHLGIAVMCLLAAAAADRVLVPWLLSRLL